MYTIRPCLTYDLPGKINILFSHNIAWITFSRTSQTAMQVAALINYSNYSKYQELDASDAQLLDVSIASNVQLTPLNVSGNTANTRVASNTQVLSKTTGTRDTINLLTTLSTPRRVSRESSPLVFRSPVIRRFARVAST